MKKNAAELKKARETLELGNFATLKEIKAAYRSLVKKWHPDKCKGKDCHEKMKQINRAYKFIMEYIDNYLYSFEKEKAGEEDQEAFWMRRFGKDPHWGEGW